MRNAAFWCGIAALVLTMICGNAYAGDTEPERTSLKGLKAIYVLVEPLNKDIIKDGLNTETIKTDVEEKLRLAGIRILSRADFVKELGYPYLYVNANALKLQRGGYVYNIDVALMQAVILERFFVRLQAQTWSREDLGATPRLDTIRDSVKILVDLFINAYRSANPER
jgi:hypothetical protein